MEPATRTRLVIMAGRMWGWLSLMTLLLAWTTEVTGRPILGMTQQHFFNDAIVLALLSICNLLDSLVHIKVDARQK